MGIDLLGSDRNPLRIAVVPAGGGEIGITFAPGKRQPNGMTGAHHRDLGADLDVIAAWNAAAVVTLVEAHELRTLGIEAIGAEVRRRHMEWHHWPIRDYDVPDAAFMAAWSGRAAMLAGLLARGGRVLVHCKGGLGRAGTIAARLLVEAGAAAADAIAAVRAVRPGAIETAEQAQWVAAAHPAAPPPVAGGDAAARDRAVGALLGLAVGDALGAAIEFSAKPRLALLDDLRAGGPFDLERGQWTDDTAMALALADSLLDDPALDPADLMRRFVAWRDTGAYSCTGTCFDIGNQTRAALDAFVADGEPLAGPTDPRKAGNGALMRLSPVAIRHWRNPAEMQRVAALQTRTTHGAPQTMEASAILATMLADAIAGVPLTEILAGPAAGRIEGGWRGLHRDAIRGDGFVVRALQAAVWAVARTTDYRSAVLLAANLGEDSDTTAAIAGQLAGAVYGASGIPAEWLAVLAWRERLETAAAGLFDAGAGPGRGALEALAAFLPVFEREGFAFAQWEQPAPEGGMFVMPYTTPSSEGGRFLTVLYEAGWIQPFDWAAWRATEDGTRLMTEPERMTQASAEDLRRVLTTCVRADRFCEGYLLDAFASGLLTRVVRRAAALLGEDRAA